jgi:hypothetical protein
MDSSIFAYMTPNQPIKRGGYALTTYRKGLPEKGFFDMWSMVGDDWYKCVKYYDECPENVILPEAVYYHTSLAKDDTPPYIEVDLRKARYFNRCLTDAEVDEQVAEMRSEK